MKEKKLSEKEKSYIIAIQYSLRYGIWLHIDIIIYGLIYLVNVINY